MHAILRQFVLIPHKLYKISKYLFIVYNRSLFNFSNKTLFMIQLVEQDSFYEGSLVAVQIPETEK